MNNYILELKDKDGNTKEIKLRLRSIDCIEIEKKTGAKLLDLMGDYSITTIVMLLKYMVRSSIPQFSEKEACELYDELVDNGFDIEKILTDVVYEGLVSSGFLKQEELEEMKKVMLTPANKINKLK